MLLDEKYNRLVHINSVPYDEDGSILLNFLGSLEAGVISGLACNNTNRTPESCVAITRLLLAHGAQLDTRSCSGQATVLHKIFLEHYQSQLHLFRNLELPSVAEPERLAVLKFLLEAGADAGANDAILIRKTEEEIPLPHLYVGTVTEAAYMSGMQNIWWQALAESSASGLGFDKEAFLQQQSSSRNMTLPEFKRHLRWSWLLFARFCYLDLELFEDDTREEDEVWVNEPGSPMYYEGFEFNPNSNKEEDEENLDSDEEDMDDKEGLEDELEPKESYKPDIGELWDPAEDSLCDSNKAEIEILAGYPPKNGNGLLSDMVFRLNNGCIFSTYEHSCGHPIAMPHIFADDILDEREEFLPGWNLDEDLVERLSLEIGPRTPHRWRFEEHHKKKIEEAIKFALRHMIEDHDSGSEL
ncbi:hypothetical protein ABW20_dc0101304 [Dactylellina cionopaga]|nr:hypothetical protein ABW20_dc0101304 [Dactylellina cionopaga]